MFQDSVEIRLLSIHVSWKCHSATKSFNQLASTYFTKIYS